MIRHGQTEDNFADIVAGGETDSQLTNYGEEQAQELAPYLASLSIKPAKIYHSPLQRARRTAELLNSALGLQQEEVYDLQEQDVGEWAGLTWSDPRIKFTRDIAPPNGESAAQFSARIQRAVTYCLDQQQEDGPPLLVCHGGLFFALGILYNIYESITHVHNCHLYYFEPYRDYPFFPWKITHFYPEDQDLKPDPAPFCATKLLNAKLT